MINQIGDYWVIYLLSKNLSPVAMKVSLTKISTFLNIFFQGVAGGAEANIEPSPSIWILYN